MQAYSSTVKPYKGLGMEGAVARWYAAQTKKSLADFEMLAERIAAELSPGSSVLEVAPGPGYFAIELAKRGDYRVTGLDISQTFVEIARTNAARANVQAQFERGNASAMPFENERFDYVVCRAAFKNFAAPVAALQEMCRVLKSGGSALIVDLRRDASRDSIRQAVRAMNTGALNRMMIYLTFRFMLLKRAYTKADFDRMIGLTAFRTMEIRTSLIGLEVLLEKV